MNKRGRKSTAEIAARRVDVLDMLMQGKSKDHIVSYISSNYGVALSTIELDITGCYIELKNYLKNKPEDVIAEHIGRYELLYRRALEIGNDEGARKALQAKEKIMQLYKEDPLVVINNNTLNMFKGIPIEKLNEINKILDNE